MNSRVFLARSMIRFKKKQKSVQVSDQNYWILISKVELWEVVLLSLNVDPKSVEYLGFTLIDQIKQRLEIAKEVWEKNKLKVVIKNYYFLKKSG